MESKFLQSQDERDRRAAEGNRAAPTGQQQGDETKCCIYKIYTAQKGQHLNHTTHLEK